LPLLVADLWASLPFSPLRLLVNNRKIAEGFYRSIGIKDVAAALRSIDKLDKLGQRAVHGLLMRDAHCTDAQASACLELAGISAADLSFADQVRSLGARDPLLDEGLAELIQVVDAAQQLAPGMVVADMRVARGLDYYTGTVYEGSLIGHEQLGAVCSGGRYDNLASTGDTLKFPGVGLPSVSHEFWRVCSGKGFCAPVAGRRPVSW
jgi:histidyl-tRNA synthetase